MRRGEKRRGDERRGLKSVRGGGALVTSADSSGEVFIVVLCV